MQTTKTNYAKIFFVLLITISLFSVAVWSSYYFNTKKMDQLKAIEDKISLDLLSSETQFSLLQELSCKDISTTILSSELNSLADKISYSENNIGINNASVINLKKSYSLLEIKDFLLMKKVTERCGQKSIFVLYFYNNDVCDDCVKQGYVLTSLREKYPNLRVYSFDYNLDLSAIKTMISIYKVPSQVPALVINGKVYSGFQSVEDIEKTFPQLQSIKKNDLPKKDDSISSFVKKVVSPDLKTKSESSVSGSNTTTPAN
ncbi:MAG: hypothetical protein WC089_04210 [Candidatus Paceibacterota bacterium]